MSFRILNLLNLIVPLVTGAIDTPRHLVYPPPADGAPTKVQLILGLGLPMEVAATNTIIGYVMKFNYNLPYNATTFFTEPYYDRLERATKTRSSGTSLAPSRYEVYKMLESTSRGGKACLLRAICETAATPLNTDGSLFAQLLHAFLTPSSTDDEYDETTDQQYLAAESIGLRQDNDCAYVFRDCDTSILQYFSKIL